MQQLSSFNIIIIKKKSNLFFNWKDIYLSGLLSNLTLKFPFVINPLALAAIKISIALYLQYTMGEIREIK